jgi:hypothetical protein
VTTLAAVGVVRGVFARMGDTHMAAAAVLSAEQGCTALAAAAAGQLDAVLGTPVAAEMADETLREGAVAAAGTTQGWAVGQRTAAQAAAGSLQAVVDTQRPEQAAPLWG